MSIKTALLPTKLFLQTVHVIQKALKMVISVHTNKMGNAVVSLEQKEITAMNAEMDIMDLDWNPQVDAKVG